MSPKALRALLLVVIVVAVAIVAFFILSPGNVVSRTSYTPPTTSVPATEAAPVVPGTGPVDTDDTGGPQHDPPQPGPQ